MKYLGTTRTVDTVAQRNKRMDKIFAPEITRLQKAEKVAEEILTELETMVDIDPCGLERCHLINAIQRILSQKTKID
jgi:hypothetical protein